MKKLRKPARVVLNFAAGVLAGMFIRLSFEIVNGRPAAIGGEALILPLIGLLIWFGAQLGAMGRALGEYERGYEDGYADGHYDGTVEVYPVRVEVTAPGKAARG